MAILAVGVIWLTSLALRVQLQPLNLGQWQPSVGGSLLSDEARWIAIHGALLTAIALCASLPLIVARMVKNRYSARLRRLIVLMTIAIALASGVPLVWITWELIHNTPASTLARRGLELANHSIFFFAFAGFIGAATRVVQAGLGGRSRMEKTTARGLMVAATVVGAPLAAWLYWQMLWYAPFPGRDYGPVNHYERIMAIASHMRQY